VNTPRRISTIHPEVEEFRMQIQWNLREASRFLLRMQAASKSVAAGLAAAKIFVSI
jgi:hypothetical protein